VERLDLKSGSGHTGSINSMLATAYLSCSEI